MNNDPIIVNKTGPWGDFSKLERILCGSRGKRAADFHDACEIALKRGGWTVTREYRVELPEGRRGFVDLFASSGDLCIALELDNRSARKKSILKLSTCPPSWLTGVLLRNPK